MYNNTDLISDLKSVPEPELPVGTEGVGEGATFVSKELSTTVFSSTGLFAFSTISETVGISESISAKSTSSISSVEICSISSSRDVIKEAASVVSGISSSKVVVVSSITVWSSLSSKDVSIGVSITTSSEISSSTLSSISISSIAVSSAGTSTDSSITSESSKVSSFQL